MVDTRPKPAFLCALTDAPASSRLGAPCATFPAPGETRYDSGPWKVEGISRATWYRRSRPIPPPESLAPHALSWYCVRTFNAAERLAATELGLAGFEVFAPTEWRPAEPARRYSNGSVRPARPDRVVPFFRRYIFVRFNRADPSWGDIRDLPGVQCIVSASPGMPITVRAAAIDFLRALTNADIGTMHANDCIYPPGVSLDKVQPDVGLHEIHAAVPVAPLAVGSTVLLVDGVMVDRKVICGWSNGKRVAFVMQFFGRDVPVTVLQSRVEAV